MSFVLDGLEKSVADEVHLYPINLELQPGSLTVLLGPTRAGKTSLLRLLAGLDQPTAGRILHDGKDLAKRRLQRRSVAMVYQEFINYPNMTVGANIGSPLRLKGLSRSQVKERVQELAQLVHIDHLLQRRPHELSGGQQQRLAIARALASDANLLLLDEPLVNLDLKLREELRVELRRLFTERGLTVVYATSEPQEALILGGDVVILHEGRLRQTAPVLQAYHRPADRLAGRLFSDPPMNQWRGDLRQGQIHLSEDLRLAVPPHLQGLAAGAYCFGIRANHLHLRQQQTDWVPMLARVDMAEINGSESFVHAQHAALPFVVQEEGAHHHAGGSTIDCFIDPSRLMAFADDDTGALLASYEEAG